MAEKNLTYSSFGHNLVYNRKQKKTRNKKINWLNW